MTRKGVRVLGIVGALAAAAVALLARRRNGRPAQATPTPAAGQREAEPIIADQARAAPTDALGQRAAAVGPRSLPVEVVAVILSGTFIGAAGAICYVLGAVYGITYFRAFGVSDLAIDMPSTFYLLNGGSILFAALMVTAPINVIRFTGVSSSGWILWADVVLIAAGTAGLLWGSRVLHGFWPRVAVLIVLVAGVGLGVVLGVLTKPRRRLQALAKQSAAGLPGDSGRARSVTRHPVVAAVIVIFVVALGVASVSGRYTAHQQMDTDGNDMVGMARVAYQGGDGTVESRIMKFLMRNDGMFLFLDSTTLETEKLHLVMVPEAHVLTVEMVDDALSPTATPNASPTTGEG